MRALLLAVLLASCADDQPLDPHAVVTCDLPTDVDRGYSCEPACADPTVDPKHRTCRHGQFACNAVVADGVLGCCWTDPTEVTVLRFYPCDP